MWSSSTEGQQAQPNSEVVVMSDMPPPELVTRASPVVSNMNITKSSRVHIGPKFVSVTNNVENTELVKGRILGLELQAPAKQTGLRCSVAVFVCWALVIAVGLGLYLFQVVTQPKIIDLGLNESWYFRRDDWQAMPAYDVKFLSLPVHYVIIGHSGSAMCNTTRHCIESMLEVQEDHLRRDFEDIGPNFLVGGEGTVFEGRGPNVIGAMFKGWNSKSISIMFLGDYNIDKTAEIQFVHVRALLEQLEKQGILAPDYELYGQCQLSPDTVPPGRDVVQHLDKLPHWKSADTSTSLERLLGAEDSDTEFYTWSDYQEHRRSTRNKTYPCPLYVWTIVRNTTRAERLSCALALLALILCTALIIYFTVLAKGDVNEVDRAPHEWNITREMWLARPPSGNNTVEEFTPLKLVIVQHTVSPECHRFTNCAAEMRNLQRYFMDTAHLGYDLPYNFVIGNDGRVYQSRGWLREGAHTAGYNRCSLGVAFIGDYREQEETGLVHSRVTDLQLQRFNMLLEEGVERGFLRPDYSILGASDVTPTVSPGANLYSALQKLDHFERTYSYRNMTCEAIYKMLDGETGNGDN